MGGYGRPILPCWRAPSPRRVMAIPERAPARRAGVRCGVRISPKLGARERYRHPITPESHDQPSAPFQGTRVARVENSGDGGHQFGLSNGNGRVPHQSPEFSTVAGRWQLAASSAGADAAAVLRCCGAAAVLRWCCDGAAVRRRAARETAAVSVENSGDSLHQYRDRGGNGRVPHQSPEFSTGRRRSGDAVVWAERRCGGGTVRRRCGGAVRCCGAVVLRGGDLVGLRWCGGGAATLRRQATRAERGGDGGPRARRRDQRRGRRGSTPRRNARRRCRGRWPPDR